MEGDSKRKTNIYVKVLFGLIGVAIILAIAVIVLFVLSKKQSTAHYDAFMEEVSESMGTDNAEGVADPTKATILSQNIQKKYLETPEYTLEEAAAEYKTIFDEASGETKFYLAIEYATFLRDYLETYYDGIDALLEVESMAGDSTLYYDLLAGLYDLAGDSERYDYYHAISENIKNSDTGIVDLGE